MPPASPPTHTRRYSAFVSYRHADNTQEGRRWAEWLHRALERYVVPPDLIGTPNLRGEPIRDSLYPIFRDEDELPANADLATGIRAALEVSDHLIVLCSPRSALSPWVRKEVREFKELGRSDRILAIIIAGEPNADDPAKARDGILRDEECFCEELRFGIVRPDGTLDWTARTEPTAADLRPIGTRAEGFVTAEAYREYLTLNSSLTSEKITTRTEAYRQQLDQALLKVIAGLLGVPLGQLIDRDAAHRTALAEKEAERQRQIAERERQLAEKAERSAIEARLAEGQARAARSAAVNTARRFAISAAAALLLALLAAFYWREAGHQRDEAEAARNQEKTQRLKVEQAARNLRSASEKQDALLLSASYGDHEAALRAAKEGRHGEALAYFERALRLAPKNTSALAASASFALGPSAPKWWTRAVVLCGERVSCLAFSPDGRWLVAGGGSLEIPGEVRVINVTTSKEVGNMKFGDSVTSVDFTLDGRLLAAGSWDKTTRVIETATGKEILNLKFEQSVTEVNFSPNGRWLAVRCEELAGKVETRLIEVTTGKELRGPIIGAIETSEGFNPDGRWLAVSFEDGTARVIEANTGRQISKITLETRVTNVSFSPDGCWLAAGCEDNTARVFEAATGREVAKFSIPVIVTNVSFSPDGRWLAAGCEDNTARVLEAATGREVSKINFNSQINSVSFSPDGRWLATGWGGFDTKGDVRVIEAATGKEVYTTEFGDSVTDVSFSLDGRWLAVGSGDGYTAGEARVIEAAAGKEVCITEFGDSVTTVSLSLDGRWMVAGSKDNTVRVIETTTGRETCGIAFDGPVSSVVFSPDGHWLAAGSDDKTARVVETATGKEVSRIEFSSKVNTVSFSSDGRWVAAGSGDVETKGEARVIEAATGKGLCNSNFDESVNIVRFSPNGHWLVAGTGLVHAEGETRVIEVATGKQVRVIKLGEAVRSVEFSPAGRWLAVGTGVLDSKGEAWVIDADTGEEVSVTKLGNSVTSVRFGPDGRWLVVGGSDKTARVIESATGREVSRTDFDGFVWDVCFSLDGRLIATGSGDFYTKGEARVIEAATGKELSTIEAGTAVLSVGFSPDLRWLAAGSTDSTARLFDARWLNPLGEASDTWRAMLQAQARQHFQADGRLVHLSAEDRIALQGGLTRSLQTSPSTVTERWCSAILVWALQSPYERTTSPWTQEPLRRAAGRWFMEACPQKEDEAPNWTSASISDTADQVPWHPLSPISLARLEPEPSDKGYDLAQGSVRPAFLARLTLKRLRDADEQLYGRETLAEYAAWSAKIMHEELKLDDEAKEALAFALERTPPDKQKELLELKAALEGR